MSGWGDSGGREDRLTELRGRGGEKKGDRQASKLFLRLVVAGDMGLMAVRKGEARLFPFGADKGLNKNEVSASLSTTGLASIEKNMLLSNACADGRLSGSR